MRSHTIDGCHQLQRRKVLKERQSSSIEEFGSWVGAACGGLEEIAIIIHLMALPTQVQVTDHPRVSSHSYTVWSFFNISAARICC